MSTINTDTLASLKDQAAQLLHDVVEQATNRAMAETQGTRSRASRLVRTGRSKDIAPSARDIALNAASGAIELWQAARERAEGTLGSVQASVADSASELRSSAHGISSEALGAARSVTTSVGDSARHVTTSVGDSARHVTTAVGDSAHKAADTGKTAAAASARAGKNTASLLFWSAAAGAIAYFAFLDEDRRNQVKHVAMRAIDEGRAILSDLRGEDGEFA